MLFHNSIPIIVFLINCLGLLNAYNILYNDLLFSVPFKTILFLFFLKITRVDEGFPRGEEEIGIKNCT